MALPRYQNVGVEVAGGIRGIDFPSRGEATRGIDAITHVLDKMSESFFKEAAVAATAEGEKYGAENAPTPEQIAEARKLNQPVAPIGDSRTYFGKAANQAATRIAAKNVAVDAELEMGRIQNDISAGRVSANDVIPRVNALAKGYSGALKEFDPVMARSVEADLALHGNKMFLAASKKATADAIAAQGAKALEAGEETYRNNVKFIIANGDQLLQGPNVDGNASVYTVQQQIDDAYAKAENQFKSLPKAARKEAMKSLPVWAQAEFKSFVIDKIVTAKSEDELKPVLEGIQNRQYEAFFTANKDEALTIKKALTSAINEFEAQPKRDLVQQQAELRQIPANYDAALTSGKTITPGVVKSDDEIRKIFKNNPLAGEELIDKIKISRETYESWLEYKYKPATELVAERKRLKDALDAAPFNETAIRLSALNKLDVVITQRSKMLADDPATFAANLPEVKAAFAETQKEGVSEVQRTTSWEKYGNTMKSVQMGLGLSEHEVKILPKGVVDGVVAEWELKKSGQNIATWLQSESNRWGAMWPDVMKQMQSSLPAAAPIIATMQNSVAAKKLAELYQPDNTKALKQFLSENHDTSKAINVALERAMKPFESSVSAYIDGPAISELWKGTVKTLAAGYAMTGKSPNDAVTQAYKEILGSQYSFHDTFRVPLNIKNPEVVARTANELMFYLRDYNIRIPESVMEQATGRDVFDKKEAYMRHLREYGKWVNVPDDRYGLRLLDGNGGPVILSDGSFFEMGWADLATPISRPVYQFGRQITSAPDLPRTK